MSKTITLRQIKKIIQVIKNDDEWVNDSHNKARYNGICDGLDILIKTLNDLIKEPYWATTETTSQNMSKVLDLSLSDVMQLSDEGIVDANLFDGFYYYLLDNKKLRKYLGKKD